MCRRLTAVPQQPTRHDTEDALMTTQLTEGMDTEQALDAVRASVEVRPTDRIASHLHPEGSFDLADHPVPTGREEVWRFTPLKRLRGLHDGTFTPGPSATVEVEAPQPVVVELVGRDDPRLGSVLTPGDRVSAQAWASFPEARVVTVPAEAELAEPVLVTVTGHGLPGEGNTEFGHLF